MCLALEAAERKSQQKQTLEQSKKKTKNVSSYIAARRNYMRNKFAELSVYDNILRSRLSCMSGLA